MRERDYCDSEPRPVDAAVYDRTYFLNDCNGHEEFSATGGQVLPERLARVLAYAQVEPDMRVLDVGCGRGESLVWLARQGAEGWGVDYAREALRLAAETLRAAEAGVRASCQLLCANARLLPFATELFDRVLMLDVVEHLHPWELEQALLEIWRLLKPGGKLIVHTAPNRWYYRFGYPLFRTFERLRGVQLPKDPRLRFRCHALMHVNEQSPWSLKRVLARCGYRSRIRLLYKAVDERESPRGIARVKNLAQWLPVSRWVFRNDIVAVAEKPGSGIRGGHRERGW